MSSPLQGRRILVVEDEALVGLMIEAMLEELSCTVVAVIDRVDDAVALVTGGAEIDAALLDVNVMGVTSFPVAAALEARGTPFVFCSGYGAGALPPEWTHRPVIQKPYVEADVRQALMKLFNLGFV